MRTASCSCGQLTVTVEGDPVRVSVCHCLACQQRTGSAFGVQARWHRDQVTVTGESRQWNRVSDAGEGRSYAFCPTCGATLTYTIESWPDHVAVPVGNFADPSFPPPGRSIYESRRHPWLELHGEMEHHA